MNTFSDETRQRIEAMGSDPVLQADARAFCQSTIAAKYSYNFLWLGRPIIQYPQDICALQEIIWRTRPDLIVEAGIAHGGSLILSASMLALLDYCDASAGGTTVNPRTPRRRVLGIDIDIRDHNRAAVENHPLAHHIDMIEGSSISEEVISQVRKIASRYERVMIILDSNHTHEHVLSELEAYGPLTSRGCYCVVFDTIVEDLPDTMFPDRPWGKGDNPKTAVIEYLARLGREGRKACDGSELKFRVDDALEGKLLVTVAPSGYLVRL